MNAAPKSCRYCKEPHHSAYSCPLLCDPLNQGFHTGGNGGQGHSHDDEEDSISPTLTPYFYWVLVENETIKCVYDCRC